jgi:hypothetical protein
MTSKFVTGRSPIAYRPTLAVLAVLAAVTLLGACSAAAPARPGALARCDVAPPPRFSDLPKTLDVVRVYTGPGGRSRLEVLHRPGKFTPLFDTGKQLGLFDLGAADFVKIVVGPPDLDLPMHPAPYREAFLVIGGGADIVLGDGTRHSLTPGSVVLFEDTDATDGHAGRTGPCGYIAVDLVPGKNSLR